MFGESEADDTRFMGQGKLAWQVAWLRAVKYASARNHTQVYILLFINVFISFEWFLLDLTWYPRLLNE